MTEVVPSGKACAVNPLKLSPALGAALAFLGIERCLPLLHGSQGCTAFALVLMVRHFREAIPLQTTAMSELSTILGGADNVEQAIGTIVERARPRLIGICSTALTETRGEDMAADLRAMRQRHPEWDELAIVYAATPDYAGSLEQGWGAAATALVETLVPEGSATRALRQVNVLVGSHLTPADVEEVKDTVEAFGLTPVVVPDLSTSLDGHLPEAHVSTSLGGTAVEAVATMGRSLLTLAIGEQMRGAAEALQRKAGVPFRLLPHVSGLEASDAFVAALLSACGGAPVPARLKRERSRLIDAMLDSHFHFEGKRIAIAAEADLLRALASLFAGMGAEIACAVAASASASLASVPADRVLIGDLDDLEQGAAGCDLVVGNSHAAEAARRLGRPVLRAGFPVYDRLGAAQRLSAGYRGTRQALFEAANLLMEHTHAAPAPDRGAASAEDGRHAEAQAG